MITVSATRPCLETPPLNYCIPIKGVVCSDKVKKIHIVRVLESTSTVVHVQSGKEIIICTCTTYKDENCMTQ